MSVRKVRLVATVSEPFRDAVDAACERTKISEAELIRVAVADFIGYEITDADSDPVYGGKPHKTRPPVEVRNEARRVNRNRKNEEIQRALDRLRGELKAEATIVTERHTPRITVNR